MPKNIGGCGGEGGGRNHTPIPLDIWRNTCENFSVICEGILKLSSGYDSGRIIFFKSKKKKEKISFTNT